MRFTRIHFVPDSLESGSYHHGNSKIWVTGTIGRAQLNPPSSARDSQGIGPIIVTVGNETGGPSITRGATLDDQTFITVYRWR